MAYTAKDPHPPRCFLYLRETKSWLCGEEGEEEEEEEGDNVHLKTHATARGVGKIPLLTICMVSGHYTTGMSQLD